MWLDAHLDMAWAAVQGRDLTTPCPDRSEAALSLPDLAEGDVHYAFATIFTDPPSPQMIATHTDEEIRNWCHEAGLEQLAVYENLERDGHIRIVRSTSDLDVNCDCLSIVLLMEGADPIRRPDEVSWWFERGLRVVGLTWAMGSRYAGGNAQSHPLTDEGRALITALDEYKIVHDLSHLADPAVDELLSISHGPVIASHSNARHFIPGNERHIQDAHIKEISNRNGVIGLNLFSQFLTPNRRARVADCVDHISHICSVMGHHQGCGLGSDLDGGFAPTQMPEGLDHPSKYGALSQALRQRGWSASDIRGFEHANWLNFLRTALPND